MSSALCSSAGALPRPGDVLGGRYVLVAALGEGKGGVVFRARDRWCDREVALKVQRDESTAAAEFIAALEAEHPALVRALDAGRTAAGPYLVMDLAGGDEPTRVLRPGDAESVAVFADQVLDALSFLHARGVVHGDLKPANVRVEERDGRLRARLIDMGLSRALGTSAAAGTAAYAAPEALAGAPADARSDLYSLGALLYELLAGELPYGDPSDGHYLSRALAGAPPPPSAPPALAAFVLRLLEREPSARFASAVDARAALHDAVPMLAGAYGVSLAEIAPRLIERDAALCSLAAIAARALAGSSARARITGPPGSGRSRLLARAALEAARAGLSALLARPDGRRLGVVLQVLERAAALPGGAACRGALNRLREATEREAPAASALLAAAEALASTASARPLWVGLDDLDEADEDSREALAFLTRGEGPIAWVAACAESAGPSLGDGVEGIELAPLSRRGVGELVASMLPGLVEAEALGDIAHGAGSATPRQICEGLQELQRSGALRLVSGRWRLLCEREVAAAAFDAGNDARAARGIARLSPAHRTVLGVAALAGGPLLPGTLADLAAVSEPEALSALCAGVAAGVACERAARTYEVAAPAREALSRAVSPTLARAVHARALALREGDPSAQACGARSVHALALGDVERATREALAAAAASAAAGSPRAAAGWYARARALGCRDASVLIAQGDALAAAGDLAGALTAYDAAAGEGASGELLALRRGRALARAGRYAEAERVLADAGEGAEVRFWRAWSLLHVGEYDHAASLAELRGGEGDIERARLGRALGTVLWHRGRHVEARELMAEARAHAEASGDAALCAELDMSLGTALRHMGELDAADEHYGRAAAHFRAVGDAAMLGRCLNNMAGTAYLAGRWDDARVRWEAFADLAARLDDAGERALAYNNLGVLWRDRGELARAQASLERAATIAREGGLRRYEAMALGNLAEVWLLGGELTRAEEALVRCEQLAGAIGARGELAECARRRAALRLARGDYAAALESAREAARLAGEVGEDLERGNALLVAAAAARHAGELDVAGERLREARAAFGACGTGFERARADLEEARLLRALGDVGASRAMASRAARAFADLGAARDLASAQELERGMGQGDFALELAVELAGAPTASEVLERVLDRLLAVTGAERGLVVLLEGPEAPRVAALRHRPGVEAPLPRLSRSIAERVIASRRPLVLADVGEYADLAARESVVSMGLRAALAAPLMRGERCLGLLYMDSRHNPADLARWGLWPLEVAAAVVASPLDLLLARERERERARTLRATAESLLESMSTIDAALELVAEEDEPVRRAGLARDARRRCASLVARADAVLEMLREGSTPAEALPIEGVDVAAVVRYALEGYRQEGGGPAPMLRVPPALPRVRADALGLARVIVQAVDAVAGGHALPLVVRAFVCEDDGCGAVLGWRPGGGDSDERVRVVIERAPSHMGWAEARIANAVDEVFELDVARRALSRWGGGLRVERGESGARRVVVDLCPACAGEGAMPAVAGVPS